MHAVLTHLLLAAVGASLFLGRDLGGCLERDSTEVLVLFEMVEVGEVVEAGWSSSVMAAISCRLVWGV